MVVWAPRATCPQWGLGVLGVVFCCARCYSGGWSFVRAQREGPVRRGRAVSERDQERTRAWWGQQAAGPWGRRCPGRWDVVLGRAAGSACRGGEGGGGGARQDCARQAGKWRLGKDAPRAQAWGAAARAPRSPPLGVPSSTAGPRSPAPGIPWCPPNLPVGGRPSCRAGGENVCGCHAVRTSAPRLRPASPLPRWGNRQGGQGGQGTSQGRSGEPRNRV